MAGMRAILARLEALPVGTCLWIVAGVAVLQRALMWALYPAVPLGDTGSYRRSAEAILNSWGNYDGTRTPGYPAFMALVGADQRVYLGQLALGLGITLLFFYIGWKITGKAWFGALIALLHTLNGGQFFFEANLMTETLATFWLALAWAGMAYLLAAQVRGRKDVWMILGVALVVGLATGLAVLTRPLFIYLPFWMAFFLILFPLRDVSPGRGADLKVRAAAALLALLPALVLIGLWVNFIHERFHVWSLSSMNGYHMIQHTGEFFEYVPDEYAALRDTYIKYRDARVARYGTQANTIWDAIPELERVSGESFYGLSRLIQKISFRLIIEHPTLYLRNVALGWAWFWKVPVYWSQAAVGNPWMLAGLRGLILLERGLLFTANLLFIAGSVALVASKRLRQRLNMASTKSSGAVAFMWFTVSAIWVASVLQTLLDHGDNPRFSVPLQSLIVLVALYWAMNYALSRPENA